MTAPADTGDALDRLGFVPQQVVQEYGYDSDVDDAFRFAVEDLIGSELEDEDFTGAADAAVLWWRADDGDLADGLVDVIGTLSVGGFVIVLTPRAGLPGSVEAQRRAWHRSSGGPGGREHFADLRLAVRAVGRVPVGAGWTATRVLARRGPSRH